MRPGILPHLSRVTAKVMASPRSLPSQAATVTVQTSKRILFNPSSRAMKNPSPHTSTSPAVTESDTTQNGTMAKKSATARARAAAAMRAIDPAVNIATLESLIDYSFTNKLLAWEALQLPGNGFATLTITNGNKRLAVVGDQVIDLILLEGWFASGMDEGECCTRFSCPNVSLTL